MIADWLSATPPVRTTPSPAPGAGLTVDELLLVYWRFAESYYVTCDGLPSSELACIRQALRHLRRQYGTSVAANFGPLALKNVRNAMIAAGLSRSVINHHIGRIRRAFKWAASEELVPVTVHEALRTVAGLRYGRSAARETTPVAPVEDTWVDATIPYVAPQIAAMIRLQRLTGMRAGEVVVMRSADIDRSGDIWLYEPHIHKNKWRGHRRIIPLGPLARAIVEQFLVDTKTYLFSPRDADLWHREQRGIRSTPVRKTPIYPCELRARAVKKLARRNKASRRAKRDRYDTASYRRAIEYGIQRAKKAGIDVEHWHPHQLRHRRATDVRSHFGLEAAQVTLGHARADITQIYAQKNLELAITVARDTG